MSNERIYEILDRIGSGGFGDVYRARLHVGDFSKEVAIKVLNDPNPPDDVLQRFRDEARILGLVRDRAIVSVDPPTRLSGRWAVVMDFVDGVNVSRALRALGPMPPGVALEIVAEVARVLDKMHRSPGPKGTPLGLLHRDLKPGNIQITRTGEIRLLDFGTARAQFDGRESRTTSAVMGTPGYIAPERLLGVETPSGDVYSLGVTLWVMLTGESPSLVRSAKLQDALNERAPDEGPLRNALLLAVAMRNLDETERPSHVEVEERALQLRRSLPAPWLRDWAKQLPGAHSKRSGLVGERLVEDDPGASLVTGSGLTTQRLALVGGGLFTSMGVIALLSIIVLALLVAVVFWSNTGTEVPTGTHASVAKLVPGRVPPSVPIDVPTDAPPEAMDPPSNTDEAGTHEPQRTDEAGGTDEPERTDEAVGADEPEPIDEPEPYGPDVQAPAMTDRRGEGEGVLEQALSEPPARASGRTGRIELTKKSNVHVVWAVRDGVRVELGEVPAGVYRLTGQFTSAADSTFKAGPFVVRQGKTTRIYCDPLAWRCVAR